MPKCSNEQKRKPKLGHDPRWPDTPAGAPRSLRLSRRVRCVHTGHSGRETWSAARTSNHGALRRSGIQLSILRRKSPAKVVAFTDFSKNQLSIYTPRSRPRGERERRLYQHPWEQATRGGDPTVAGDVGEPAARQDSGAARRPGGDLGRRRSGLECGGSRG